GADLVVWTPDALGSICFLVASELAFAEAGHAWFSWRRSDMGWRIAALNLIGSVFFAVSAIAGWVQPSTGDLLDAALDSSGTFWGRVASSRVQCCCCSPSRARIRHLRCLARRRSRREGAITAPVLRARPATTTICAARVIASINGIEVGDAASVAPTAAAVAMRPRRTT